MAVPIPDRLALFIRERLPSLEQIEIVLLLRRESGRGWTAPEVSQNLATPPESTAMRLFLLASNGVIVFDGSSGLPRYRYTAGESESDLEELERIYEVDHNTLVELVGGTVAPDPLRSFADAFKLKK
ncbi:MAG TPA: hypothetical protein VE010_01920 [Thermoanaerobaculia bacterium]|nr:hypothetical protein [Thermoanaerobaculia bacterium]